MNATSPSARGSTTVRRFITTALAAALCASVSAADNDLSQQKLHGRWAKTNLNGHFFGYSAALSAKHAIVGGYGASDIIGGQGSAQVYDSVTGAWQRQLVRPGPPLFTAQFGVAVAVSGNLAVVGATGGTTNPGKAYVYDLTNGKLKATLESQDTANGDYFGLSIAIRGNIVAIGSPFHDGKKGAVYLYQATTGQPIGKLQAPNAMNNEKFGTSVAIEGSILAVGMPGANNDTGALSLIDLSTYSEITRFTPNTAAAGDEVGNFVSMQGGRVALCTSLSSGGKVYLYDIPTTTWDTLTPSDPFAENYFGYSAVVDGNRVLVGSIAINKPGQVYVFDATTGNELGKFSAQDASDGDGFGRSLGLCGNTALVGRVYDDDQGPNVGAGYLMRSIITPMPLSKVVARGDFTPGAPECKYGVLGDAFINNNSETAFVATLAGAGSHNSKDSAAVSDLLNLGSLGLLRKSGQQYNPTTQVAGVSGVILNNPDLTIGRGKLVGAGITPASNQFIWWANGAGAAGTHLRTGTTVTEFSNAMPLAFPEMVQSIRAATPRMAVSCTLQQTNGVTAANDSGIWALSTGSAPVAVREGSMIPGTNYYNGQFTGRVSFLLDQFVYSTALTGNGITPQNNAAILQRPTGAAEKIIVQKGATPAGIPGTTFTSFVGELGDGSENVLYRATIAGNGVTTTTNEGLWLQIFNGAPKLQLRKGQSIPSIPGVTISRILQYWATAAVNSRTVALVRLAGPGVKASNDQAIVIVEANDTPFVLMREGEPAAGCTPATIGTISRLEFDSWFSRYAVICTLTGAPAGTDLALYTGSLAKGNNADKTTLRRPFLRLRKGQVYEDQPSRIKSFSLPTTSMTASGAGNTGRGRAISWNGFMAVTVEFDNKVRQIMKGTAN